MGVVTAYVDLDYRHGDEDTRKNYGRVCCHLDALDGGISHSRRLSKDLADFWHPTPICLGVTVLNCPSQNHPRRDAAIGLVERG